MRQNPNIAILARVPSRDLQNADLPSSLFVVNLPRGPPPRRLATTNGQAYKFLTHKTAALNRHQLNPLKKSH